MQNLPGNLAALPDATRPDLGHALQQRASQQYRPIFVHASPRSGSTYFFNVLRQNDALLCFNEAIIDGKHDLARFKNSRKRILDSAKQGQDWINHQFLEREEFAEFIDAWDAVMHLCPKFPTFEDYLPADGLLAPDLYRYFSALQKYARSKSKRPVFCEINSRGRAAALRGAFGGFHIAQYRDPIHQFGSFVRAVIEGGFWGFLAFPATELGASSKHPLYSVIPKQWRPATCSYRASSRAQHWASDALYIIEVASPEAIPNVFRWHLFSWFLTNLAAITYSDLAFNIDDIDDADFRALFSNNIAAKIGFVPKLDDFKKFDRHYEFESFDYAAISAEVVATLTAALDDRRLEDAIDTLGVGPQVVSTEKAFNLLVLALDRSLQSIAKNTDRQRISGADWKDIATKNSKIWFRPGIRRIAEHVYPLAAPVVHTARRVKQIWS
jgi:hypothetical protein